MCIAILNESGILSDSIIRTCAINNPDGMGMAWIENGRISTFKSMNDIDKLISLYQSIRKDNEFPIMLHFRIGTHGKKDITNVHPFHVSDSLIMCHNGIVDTPAIYKDKSDTFHLSLFLSKLKTTENLIDTDSIEFLFTENYCGNYSKLIFMDNDGRFSIANENLGHWNGDTWFSNHTYEESDWIDIGGKRKKKDKKSKKESDSYIGHWFDDDYLLFNKYEHESRPYSDSSDMLELFAESYGLDSSDIDSSLVADWDDEESWDIDNWMMIEGKLTFIGGDLA